MSHEMDVLLATVRSDIASECAEYAAMERESMRKEMEKRPHEIKSIDGFYIDVRGRPAQLVRRGPLSVLCTSLMTIFTHEERAWQAIRQSLLNCSWPELWEEAEVQSTNGMYVCHFLDDDRQYWLPTSTYIEGICSELPETFLSALSRGYYFQKVYYSIRNRILNF